MRLRSLTQGAGVEASDSDCLLWLHVRSAITRAERVTGYDELDELSKRLLEWVAWRVRQLEDLYVSEIIRLPEIASPATLSRLLAGLKDRGLLSITPHPNDRRCRLVGITESATELLKALSAELQGALRGG
jgi:DNA-binding HxlR family transcriptional regulator